MEFLNDSVVNILCDFLCNHSVKESSLDEIIDRDIY